jgi:hypothetical protein
MGFRNKKRDFLTDFPTQIWRGTLAFADPKIPFGGHQAIGHWERAGTGRAQVVLQLADFGSSQEQSLRKAQRHKQTRTVSDGGEANQMYR